MLYRKLRFLAVVLLAAVTAMPADGQTRRRTTKKPVAKKTTAKAKKKPVSRRNRRPVRRPVAPPVPVVRYTSPRTLAALSADLGFMTTRVRSGQFGVMAVSLTRGDTLFAWGAGAPLVPASTLKMLTTAVALEELGPNYQFSTDVLHDGTVGADGTLTGNVYLRGDGDPTLGGRYLSGGPAAPMNLLADQIAARGIRRITGEVIGDATAFDDQRIPEGWLTRYLQSGYAARVSGLSLNENLVWVTITPGEGAKLEPATSAIPLTSNVRTVKGGGARVSIRRTTDGAISVSGTIGTRSPPRRYVYVVEHPAPFATGALRSALVAKGVEVVGGIRLDKTPAGANRIASVQSPTLDRILAAMNRESINHYAELVLRNAARGPRRDALGDMANSRSMMRQFFAKKVGADTMSLQISDGSGLSTLDRVTSRAMVQMLGYAHRASWGPWFHASLPVAGESELLRRRMRGGSAQGNLHAKTGTTNDVVGLGGYVTALNGEVIAFSFIYNGRDRWTAKSMMDAMGQTLANFAR
ncbi:MAG: D-alanyl-D-alanine carboxypeptidase/D-alanyl-D-alanine-endopeptidase [Gemmatimonadaceae bacterium]|nr:D-alanyl-D-alanine carboxypeptidase/D-alanyl-D-alanine-endopeptidase [Gemmatimonadaceae bacterium]